MPDGSSEFDSTRPPSLGSAKNHTTSLLSLLSKPLSLSYEGRLLPFVALVSSDSSEDQGEWLDEEEEKDYLSRHGGA